jgi:CheY-like chemotaxis protein
MTDPAPALKTDPADKRILLIDDDEAVTQVIRVTLDLEGFKVKVGRDGKDILKRALEYKPDLIVTDLMLPGASGYELVRMLQTDDSTRKIPILMITGHHMDGSTRSMIEQEPNIVGFFEKPFRPEKLVQRIHEVLNTMSREEKYRPPSQSGPTSYDDIFRV